MGRDADERPVCRSRRLGGRQPRHPRRISRLLLPSSSFPHESNTYAAVQDPWNLAVGWHRYVSCVLCTSAPLTIPIAVKFQGGDPEWKPVARNNCTYFDVMTIPPDQNGKPGPMTITETSWMSPENVDKLIEHIHASHFDEEMDDDKRFTFMGQRCHEEPPVVEGVLPVAKVVSTKAKAKAPKRKDPAAKTPPPKPSGKPAKRKATAAPSPSPPIEKRQLRRRAAKRIDRGQEPATPEPEDGAERDEESDEGGSPFKPLEGDGEEEDELDDDDIPLSELHDLERGAGAGDDDEQDQTSKAPVDKGKGRAERTPSEEPDLEHPGADDDPPEEDEHPESTEVAATLLPRLKIFRLTHKSIKMGAKAKPWVEDFDRSLVSATLLRMVEALVFLTPP